MAPHFLVALLFGALMSFARPRSARARALAPDFLAATAGFAVALVLARFAPEAWAIGTSWVEISAALCVFALGLSGGPLSPWEEPLPQEAAPQEAAPQEAAPQEAAPQEAAPQEALSQEAAPEAEIFLCRGLSVFRARICRLFRRVDFCSGVSAAQSLWPCLAGGAGENRNRLRSPSAPRPAGGGRDAALLHRRAQCGAGAAPGARLHVSSASPNKGCA